MNLKELSIKYHFSVLTIRKWIREKKIKAKWTMQGYWIDEDKFAEFIKTRVSKPRKGV